MFIRYHEKMKIPQLLRGFVATTSLRGFLPAPSPDDLRCSVLDDDGNIRADSSYSWQVQDFSLDSLKQPDNELALTTARFTLRTLLLAEPVSCRGLMHPADLYEFQACSTSPAAPLEDPWISFDYNFLLDNYLQINQTWRCQRGTSRRQVFLSCEISPWVAEESTLLVVGNSILNARQHNYPGHRRPGSGLVSLQRK